MHNHAWSPDLFGQTLSQICEAADLNQADLARLSGKAQSTVSRWTNSRNQPNYEAIKRLTDSLKRDYPRLGNLPDRLMVAAGYGAPSASPPPPSPPDGDAAEDVFDALRAEAQTSEKKTLGDILVERGLATPEELTLSDQKRRDPIVKEILESDLSEDTKNFLLQDYAEMRRDAFRKAEAEKKDLAEQKKPRGS